MFPPDTNMTAKELIAELEDILERRDGEDLAVRFDYDFVSPYGIEQVSLLEDMEVEEDMVVLQSPECLMALEQYDIGIKMPNDPTLN
jgi:hypothetical protein